MPKPAINWLAVAVALLLVAAVVGVAADTHRVAGTEGSSSGQMIYSATSPEPGSCVGDCNGDGQVTVDELLRGVNIALGAEPVSDCPSFDCNRVCEVAVDCLLRGVNVALNGCITPPPANIAGNWLFSVTTTYDNTGDPLGTETRGVTVYESDESVWFTIQLSDPPVQMPYSGSIFGNSVAFSSVTETYTGTVSADGGSASGNYSGKNGDSLWGGSWTAARQNGCVANPPPADIAGNWLFSVTTIVDNTGDPLGTKTRGATIDQSGESAWVQFSDPPVQMPYTGSISGNSVAFSSTTETYTGAVSADGNSMSGSYSGKDGNSLWAGSWTAARQ